jgi:hypothetical protein
MTVAGAQPREVAGPDRELTLRVVREPGWPLSPEMLEICPVENGETGRGYAGWITSTRPKPFAGRIPT